MKRLILTALMFSCMAASTFVSAQTTCPASTSFSGKSIEATKPKCTDYCRQGGKNCTADIDYGACTVNNGEHTCPCSCDDSSAANGHK